MCWERSGRSWGPAFGGASLVASGGGSGEAGAGEQVEGAADLGSGPVAVEQVAQLGSGEPVGVLGEGTADLVGDGVAEAVTEEVEGGPGRVVP